ncbi:hypothetical protein QUA02_32815 [Microcoleus sp. SVA1_A4]
MPLPRTNVALPDAGTYGGVTFAMVTSPCPVPGAVCGVDQKFLDGTRHVIYPWNPSKI